MLSMVWRAYGVYHLRSMLRVSKYLHVRQSSQTAGFPSSTSRLLYHNVVPLRFQVPCIRLSHILYLSFVQLPPLTGQNLSEPHGHRYPTNSFQAWGLDKRFQGNASVLEQGLIPQDKMRLLLQRTCVLKKKKLEIGLYLKIGCSAMANQDRIPAAMCVNNSPPLANSNIKYNRSSVWNA